MFGKFARCLFLVEEHRVRIRRYVLASTCAFALLANLEAGAEGEALEGSPLPTQPTSADDSRWRAGFHQTGFDERIRAFTEFRGELIAAGLFTRAGANLAHFIARYDGMSWTPLARGLRGGTLAEALITYEDRLIAGGHFTEAGDVPVRAIAAWDGTSWEDLGGGMNGHVSALCVYRGKLVAGGNFTEAGGTPAEGIAIWDGSSWQGLSPGTSGGSSWVRAFVVYNDRLIIGGSFTSFAGVSARNIAAWDGEQAAPLSMEWFGQTYEGTSGPVAALTMFDSLLVVGGIFDNAGGRPANGIATWDTTGWKDLAGGFGGFGRVAQALVVHDGKLLVGGGFTSAGGVPANYIAEWDGASWRPLGAGTGTLPSFPVIPTVEAIASFRGDVFAGGFFILAGGVYAPAIARWDGTSWHAVALGQGLPGSSYAVTVYDGKPAVGGNFHWAGQAADGKRIDASRIALWNGAGWEALGAGVDSLVLSAVPFEGDLVVGGVFQHAGDLPVGHVARWDGATWHPMGEGFDGNVWALVEKGGVLYAAGEFERSGSTVVNHVARWNGVAWEGLGLGLDEAATTLAVHQDTLVAGGIFFSSGEQTLRFIAKWDGSIWTPIGDGFNAPVRAIATYRGDLIAAGIFSRSGSVIVDHIARWNGSTWEDIGFSGGLEVNALHVLNDKLFVGGSFGTPGRPTPQNIAAWDGTIWSALGSGTNTRVYALASLGGSLLVGGGFTFAGSKGSDGFAIWDEVPLDVTVENLDISRTEAGIRISWGLAASSASELAGIRVQRTTEPEGRYEDRSPWLVPRASMEFLEEDADPSAAYWYRLVLRHRSQTESLVGPVLIEPRVDAQAGSGASLLQVAQVGGEVQIRYRIESGPVPMSLAVYDVKGRRIVLLEHGLKDRGEHSTSWDMRDENGIVVSSGLYFVRLETRGFSASRKFLRLGP